MGMSSMYSLLGTAKPDLGGGTLPGTTAGPVPDVGGGIMTAIGTMVGGPIGGIAANLLGSQIPGMGGKAPKTSSAKSYAYANSSFAPVTYMGGGGISSMALIVIGIAVLFIFKLFGKKKR